MLTVNVGARETSVTSLSEDDGGKGESDEGAGEHGDGEEWEWWVCEGRRGRWV